MFAFKEKRLYAAKNNHHVIEVYEKFNYRWLSFGSHFIQSIIHKRNPAKPILKYLKPFCSFTAPDKTKALTLGLGGGALLHYFNHLFPGSSMTVVEYDREIENVAKRFFYLDTLSNYQIHINDALDYVTQCNEQFDRIFIDLYTSEDYPPHCANETFFAHCRQRLSPSGILSLNVVSYPRHKNLINPLNHVFDGQIIAMPIPNCGNLVFHASNEDNLLSKAQDMLNNNTIKDLHWHSDLGLVSYLRR